MRAVVSKPVTPGGWLTLLCVIMSLAACERDPVAPSETEQDAPHPVTVQDTIGTDPVDSRESRAAPPLDGLVDVVLQQVAENRIMEAMETLEWAIASYPEADVLYGIRGRLLLERDDVNAALQDLEAAVRLAPDNPQHLNNRAQAYRMDNRTEEAMVDLNRALELDADLLSARFNRGAMKFNAGDFEAALADFDHCIAVKPDAAAPYFNRAAIHDAMGKRAAAIADLRHFIEIAPSEEWKRIAGDQLQQWQAK